MIEQVTLWVCDECDYFRSDKATGRHQTINWRDPRGRMVVHDLHPVTFVRADGVGAEDEDLAQDEIRKVGREPITDAQIELYRKERF